MKSMRILVPLALLCAAFPAPSALAQKAEPAKVVEADRIVAVVNDEVITRFELRSRVETVSRNLRQQNIALPPPEAMEKQVLERMIVDRLQTQFARDAGIRVDDSQLDRALARIAENNRMSLGEFRDVLEKDGIGFARFREEVRGEILMSRVREQEVDNKVVVSDVEVDQFLADPANLAASAEEFDVSHILLRVPELASPEQIERVRARAEGLRRELAAGADFAKLAAGNSDAPDSMQGGHVGWRARERLPTLFAEAVARLKPGEVSAVLKSANGFHIVRVNDKRGGAMPAVMQTHARHILVRVSEMVSESEAQHRINSLRERLTHGGNFAELARLHSQDGSANKGGDLGWLYPGDTVPDFERAMNALKPGDISPVVRSPFGWHLIQVIERRTEDVSTERKRLLARQALRERKADESYQEWLRQMRDRAYVELRLEER